MNSMRFRHCRNVIFSEIKCISMFQMPPRTRCAFIEAREDVSDLDTFSFNERLNSNEKRIVAASYIAFACDA